MSSQESRPLSKVFLRPLALVILILFSLQMVTAHLALTQCPAESAKAHESSSEETHCNEFGFCLFGHCHVNHCSVLTPDLDVRIHYMPTPNNIGFIKESQLRSILPLDKPWQPPRA